MTTWEIIGIAYLVGIPISMRLLFLRFHRAYFTQAVAQTMELNSHMVRKEMLSESDWKEIQRRYDPADHIFPAIVVSLIWPLIVPGMLLFARPRATGAELLAQQDVEAREMWALIKDLEGELGIRPDKSRRNRAHED